MYTSDLDLLTKARLQEAAGLRNVPSQGTFGPVLNRLERRLRRLLARMAQFQHAG
ncbi:hypothetical protein [Deinococcus detaillensis]|uniref:hypothetical protein n=1 Tax=Deinococcus detaillensis TaxID=2592048 RepID=UPI00163D5836|nr:hypothetical protein [Deinococcus detaillensis]